MRASRASRVNSAVETTGESAGIAGIAGIRLPARYSDVTRTEGGEYPQSPRYPQRGSAGQAGIAGQIQGSSLGHASEEHAQFAAATILDELGVWWFHPPNESLQRGGLVYGAILVGQGVKTGVPDVCIEDAPPAFPGACGVRIELKTLVGSPSPDQRRWLDYYARRGFVARVCKGTQAFVAELRALGWDPDAAIARLVGRGWQFDGERMKPPPSQKRPAGAKAARK